MGARPRAEVARSTVLGGGALLLLAPLSLPIAVLGALTYVVGAALWPLGALGCVVASLPFYLFQRQLSAQSFSLTEATLALGALGIGVRALWDAWRGRIGRGPTSEQQGPSPGASGAAGRGGAWRAFDPPIALLLAAALLSLLATDYLRLSLRELRTLIVEPVLFFFLLRAVVRTPLDVRRLIVVLTVVATVVAILAIGQFFVGGAVTDVQGVRRVQGTYTSPNHLGLLLGRAIPFLLAAAWLIPRGRPLRLSATALCLLALLLTFSLGAWLGTGVAILIVVAALGGRRPLLAMVLVGSLAVAALLLAAPTERLAGRLDPTRGTTLVRLQLWRASVDLIRDHPLLGIGLDNFLYRYAAYVPPDAGMEPNLSHPHNLVLQFWLQLGVVGAVALGWLLVVFVRAIPSGSASGVPPPTRALAIGAAASMTDFLVHGAIDNSYFLPDMAVIFWLTIAAASALQTGDRDGHGASHAGRLHRSSGAQTGKN